jgi:hypothetical protein
MKITASRGGLGGQVKTRRIEKPGSERVCTGNRANRPETRQGQRAEREENREQRRDGGGVGGTPVEP